MPSDHIALYGAIAAVCLYDWLRIRLSALVQPLRMEAAEVGEELLCDARLPRGHKPVVDDILARTFSRAMARRLVPSFPLVMARRTRAEIEPERSPAQLPGDVPSKLGRPIRLGTITTLANSPLAQAIVTFELLVSALLVAPTGRLLRLTITHLAGSGSPSPHRLEGTAHRCGDADVSKGPGVDR